MVALTDGPHRVTTEAPAQPDQRQLVQSLCRPGVLDSGTQPVDVMETHISYVLLAGAYAYKIKKAVNLQFLDFSTLAARRHDCHEELRLNRPLAPSVYLDVVAITGTVEAPAIGGDGPVLEYALKMRQFRQDGLFSDMLARGALTDSPYRPAGHGGRVVSSGHDPSGRGRAVRTAPRHPAAGAREFHPAARGHRRPTRADGARIAPDLDRR